MAKKLKQNEIVPLNTPLVRHGFFRSFDGTRIFFTEEGKGKVLVFCQGLICSDLHWKYQMEYLRKNYRVICLDYRGQYRSDTPINPSNLSLDAIVRDLHYCLDELGIDEAVFIGHSMGTNLILDFAHRFQSRVRGLVLANGAATRPLEDVFGSNAFQGGIRVLERIYPYFPNIISKVWKLQKYNPLFLKLIMLSGFNPELVDEELVQRFVAESCDQSFRSWFTYLKDYEQVDASRWLHELDTPALVIAGRGDRLIPFAKQELLHQLIRGSEFEVVESGSHCVQLDFPKHVNLRLEKFLRDISYV